MKRLLDDAQLPCELRTDLLRSRSAGQDYQTAAKLLQLRAAFSDSSPPSAALKQAARRATHPAWKLALLATLGGGAALLARPVWREPTPVPSVKVEPAAPPAAAASEPVVPPTIAPELPAAAAPAAEAAPVRRISEPAAPANSSRREIAQLVRVRALLDRDPAAAYSLAQRSAREFPRGILAEERQALAVIALANTGARQVAQQHARQFFARSPQSPMRAAIEAALQR